MSKNHLFKLISVSLLLLALVSCSKNSTIGQLTATDSDKQSLLGPRLDKFSRAVYWGNLPSAISYVEGESRSAFGTIYSKRRVTEDIVEVKVRDIDFVPESTDEADVIIETQFYTKLTLYVNSRFEKQRWVYSRLDGGWLLRNAEIVDESEVTNLEVEDEPKKLF